MKNNVRIKNSNALVFIYNYSDRLGDVSIDKEDDHFAVDQIILNSVSLKSVSTQKSKSNPAGSFEFKLAPTKNWVTSITPGSWCIILMSNEKLDDKAKYGGGQIDEKSFKMLGRIESVRAVINTNQSSGARESEYVVTGSDWGVIFNSKFYVDILNRAPDENFVGMAERFGYDNYLLDNAGGFDIKKLGVDAWTIPNYIIRASDNDQVKAARKSISDFIINGSQQKTITPLKLDDIKDGQITEGSETGLPTAKQNVDFLLKFWGRSDPVTAATGNASGILAKSQQRFSLPNKLATYMGLVDKGSKLSPVISQVLQQKSGLLRSQDVYTDDDNSAGILDFNTILGEHTMWQILSANNNQMINELIPEIRFSNGKAALTLYNRVRPFCVNKLNNITKDLKIVGDGAGVKIKNVTVKDFYSEFKNIKRITINSNDVILSSYGTNWRDRVNFIEVNIARSLFSEAYNADIKGGSQFQDEKSISRDGLLSMMGSTHYVPLKNKRLSPEAVITYKYLLKEWHFNTHKMLNGTLNLIGQDQYIQVGDNILVESKVLNMNNFNNNAKQKNIKTKTYLLAHVESISHQTIVDANGGRVFTTSINFVRGIITDGVGNIVVTDNIVGAMDQDGSKTTPNVELNTQSFGTSSKSDPDRQKLKGD